MERNSRKYFTGTVVSDKMDKTIVVEVSTYKNHPTYGKRVRYSKKYKAHDENNECGIGDTVRIIESRPISGGKRWTLESIVEKAK